VARSTRGVTPSEAGRIMVEAAESVNAGLEHARRQVERLDTGRTKLSVATFTSGGRLLLPAAFVRLTPAHPDTELPVVKAEPEGSLPLVRQGVADLALAHHFNGSLPGRTGASSGARWTALSGRSVVRRPARRPPTGRPRPGGPRRARRRALGARLPQDRGVSAAYAERAGFDPLVRGSTTDYFFARPFVAAGVGVSLIPSIALTPDLPGLRAVAIEPPGPARHIGVATRGGRHDPRVATLVDALGAQELDGEPNEHRGPGHD
jgi:DNA-binding transcriptional LysR family regulator